MQKSQEWISPTLRSGIGKNGNCRGLISPVFLGGVSQGRFLSSTAIAPGGDWGV
ncbi:hypothetical protein LKK83_13140 [Phormidium sp. CCY1219]|nr:hypothetical protein [Phormidium sp. CCY1219]